MANYTAPGILGWIGLQKTGGAAASPTVGTTTYVPGIAYPSNPFNKAYPAVINKAGFQTVIVLGKKTPSIALQLPVKTTWFTAVNLNDIIGTNLDANSQTGKYAINVYDGSAVAYGNSTNGNRVYDVSRCAQITISQRSEGGPLACDLAWLSLYGDSEMGTPTSFAAPATDPGSLTDITKVSWNSTADQVRGFALTMLRGQGYVMYDDGTVYGTDLATGAFGGTLVMDQSPTASIIPSTAATIQIGSAGAGVQFALALSLDENHQPHTTALGNIRRTFTLYKTDGTNPCVMSAM